MQRLLFGAIAGVCATMAMTSGMRLLFGALGRKERYPLPPREITEELVPAPRRALPPPGTAFPPSAAFPRPLPSGRLTAVPRTDRPQDLTATPAIVSNTCSETRRNSSDPGGA